MTTLSDLIARLESAKEGSRELGDEVLLACGWKPTPNFDRANPHPYWISPDGTNVGSNQPDPTTSLDAALTLVPEGWGYNLHGSPPEHNCCQSASLMRGDPPYFDTEEIEASAATPALAICIAALKAREAGR